MARKRERTRAKDSGKPRKKKVSILTQDKIDYVDWKDADLLRKFMSERAKIRARRVNGNDTQQQKEIAKAIKNAREMALIPYANRIWTQRGGRGRDRGERGERGDRGDRPPRRDDRAPEGTETEATGVETEVAETAGVES